MINLIQTALASRWFKILAVVQFIVAIVIFTYAALAPSDKVSAGSCDHCLHFVGNFLLISSACVATLGRFKLWLLLLGTLPYSIAMELSQYFTQTRQFDPNDLSANLLGLVAGFLAAHLVQWIWHKMALQQESEV